jgi:hypothetical protein
MEHVFAEEELNRILETKENLLELQPREVTKFPDLPRALEKYEKRKAEIGELRRKLLSEKHELEVERQNLLKPRAPIEHNLNAAGDAFLGTSIDISTSGKRKAQPPVSRKPSISWST